MIRIPIRKSIEKIVVSYYIAVACIKSKIRFNRVFSSNYRNDNGLITLIAQEKSLQTSLGRTKSVKNDTVFQSGSVSILAGLGVPHRQQGRKPAQDALDFLGSNFAEKGLFCRDEALGSIDDIGDYRLYCAGSDQSPHIVPSARSGASSISFAHR